MSLTIGIDVDDVLFDCTGYAIGETNRIHNLSPPITMNDYTWGKKGTRYDLAIEYMESKEFYLGQPVLEGAKEFIEKLLDMGVDPIIASAPSLKNMGHRAERVIREFPELNERNIMLGVRKDLLRLDVLLDDQQHNIASSNATYPVILSRFWNLKYKTKYRADNYDAFIEFVSDLIKSKR